MRFHPIGGGPEDDEDGQEARGLRSSTVAADDCAAAVYDCKRISYWIDRRLSGLAGPDYAAPISFGLPFESEDSRYGKYRFSASEALSPDLLILDDLGLHQDDPTAGLYELVIARHRSVLVTARSPPTGLSTSGSLFDDPILGNSALDRLANAIPDRHRGPELPGAVVAPQGSAAYSTPSMRSPQFLGSPCRSTFLRPLRHNP